MGAGHDLPLPHQGEGASHDSLRFENRTIVLHELVPGGPDRLRKPLGLEVRGGGGPGEKEQAGQGRGSKAEMER